MTDKKTSLSEMPEYVQEWVWERIHESQEEHLKALGDNPTGEEKLRYALEHIHGLDPDEEIAKMKSNLKSQNQNRK